MVAFSQLSFSLSQEVYLFSKKRKVDVGVCDEIVNLFFRHFCKKNFRLMAKINYLYILLILLICLTVFLLIASILIKAKGAE